MVTGAAGGPGVGDAKGSSRIVERGCSKDTQTAHLEVGLPSLMHKTSRSRPSCRLWVLEVACVNVRRSGDALVSG